MDRAELAGALIDSCPDGLLLVDADGLIQLANPIAETLFGRTEDDLVGSSIDELVPPEFRSAHPRRRAIYTSAPTSRPMGTGLELFAQHSSGEMFPVEISLSPCTIDDAVFTIATIRDVSDRQESASQMAMLQDRERIARDLHDMVIQRLFAAGMNLQAVQSAAQPQMVADRIASTINELDDTIRELRSAIFRLGQHDERRTLSAQLTELVHERARHLGFEPVLRLVGDLDQLPDFIADQLVATVTEGLSNVVRHANATVTDVRVECVGTSLSLSISDDGVGLPDEPKRSGGLSNMMWRAAELGGSCTVGPNEPAGTRLQWHVPV
ncbi:MAG TPA: PAS domain S-box protein [Ilumatobacteraceae bacterium]|nr:PAS domain S-box protein [Ilumatobacteraceae bacterium]